MTGKKGCFILSPPSPKKIKFLRKLIYLDEPKPKQYESSDDEETEEVGGEVQD